MKEIDLIPRSYRDAARLRRLLRGSVLAMLPLAATGLAVLAAVTWQLGVHQARVKELRGDAHRAAELRRQIDAMAAVKDHVEHRAAALAALRGAGDLQRVAQSIDAALNGNVWLTSFRFQREAQPLETAAAAPEPQRYLVIRAAAQQGGSLRLSRDIEIRGASADHAALADFVKRLALQPALSEVRLAGATAALDDPLRTVAFTVNAAVRPHEKAAPAR